MLKKYLECLGLVSPPPQILPEDLVFLQYHVEDLVSYTIN